LERNLASGAVLEFDKERLRRSVLNVISNACQAMVESAKGEGLSESDRRPNGRLRVGTRIAEERAEIVVNDSGGGIPVEELGRVFQPLYSTKGFGVGLGLTIVKRIMERHGGGVEIESSPQAGTTVILWLPIKRPQPNRLTQRRRDAEKTNV
jgi:signal transduction histidine kinase